MFWQVAVVFCRERLLSLILLSSVLLCLCSCSGFSAWNYEHEYKLQDVCNMMEDVLGKDVDEAENMVEGFFDVVLVQTNSPETDAEGHIVYQFTFSEEIILEGVAMDIVEFSCDGETEPVSDIGFTSYCKDCSSYDVNYIYAEKYYSYFSENYEMILNLGEEPGNLKSKDLYNPLNFSIFVTEKGNRVSFLYVVSSESPTHPEDETNKIQFSCYYV